jgi:hypothetical protein
MKLSSSGFSGPNKPKRKRSLVNALQKLSSWTISVKMTSARPKTIETPPLRAPRRQNYIKKDCITLTLPSNRSKHYKFD